MVEENPGKKTAQFFPVRQNFRSRKFLFIVVRLYFRKPDSTLRIQAVVIKRSVGKIKQFKKRSTVSNGSADATASASRLPANSWSATAAETANSWSATAAETADTWSATAAETADT
jgi:hypothetical protein